MVELGSRILPALDEELAGYATDRMMRRGIRIELGSSVARIDDGRVTLTNGATLESETVIWCAGIAPSPLLDRLSLPRDGRGYLLCDRDLRVSGRPEVWAIGDSAVNPGPDGGPYPATAQCGPQGAPGGHRPGCCGAVPCDIGRGRAGRARCRQGCQVFIQLEASAWFLWRGLPAEDAASPARCRSPSTES
jgi:NADH dehydrogenase